MTEKIFYIDSEKYRDRGKILEIREGDLFGILLNKTIFYPEGGGQPSDRGIIRGEDWELLVTKVIEEEEKIFHFGKLMGKTPKIGEEVLMELDISLRKEYSQEHTAQHLFSAILERDYGYETIGFQILSDHTKIEIPLASDINLSYIKSAEEKTNYYIREGIPVKIYWKDEKTRIVEVLNVDINPCGGIHVKNTREIGLFKVLKVYRKNSQVWRIEFISGDRLLKRLEKREEEYEYIKQKLGDSDVVSSLDKFITKLNTLEKENKKLKEKILDYQAEEILKEGIETSMGKIVMKNLELNMGDLRILALKILESSSLCFLFNTLGELVLGKNREFPKEIWEKLINFLENRNFRGGKGENLIQGKIDNIENIKEALFQELF
ncbi:MAG: alanyl-tRNA editing protein [Dictyoglomus sp.]|nr:alanyl-tRNA editing protein [Dictyoglomus sp.]MCX7942860.1 alanyl-tRNA editing protein [Dictyoglomaceae bacterium]MDW8189088.1 alanyl-tRNA editing protein [Dictyoglomus sp.]